MILVSQDRIPFEVQFSSVQWMTHLFLFIEILCKAVVDEQLKSWHFLISNMHCVFQCNHNNQVTVVDDSANGTFVNGMRLRRGDQYVLHIDLENCVR